MIWMDVASIVFACVTANHLGLVKAIEETFDRELPIVNCVKCFSYWSVLFYTLFVTRNAITSLAISFLAGYAAIWLELFEGMIDKLYNMLYEKIYSTSDDNADSSDTKYGDPTGTVS